MGLLEGIKTVALMAVGYSDTEAVNYKSHMKRYYGKTRKSKRKRVRRVKKRRGRKY